MFLIGAVAVVAAVIAGVTFGLLERGRAADSTPVSTAPAVSPQGETTPTPESNPPESTPPESTPPQSTPPESTAPAPPANEPKEYPQLGPEHLLAQIGDWVSIPSQSGQPGGTYAKREGSQTTGVIVVTSAGSSMESATSWLVDTVEGPVPGVLCGNELELLTSCYLETESLGVLSASTATPGATLSDLAMVLEAIAAANP